MSVGENLERVRQSLPENVTLVAVSKFKPDKDILEAYGKGQRIFGESRALEVRDKHERLPKDIEWHFIGHLQTNKVKYIAPFVTLIHGVDSLNLLREIGHQAARTGRIIDCLLQVHISDEETKFGFSFDECREAVKTITEERPENIRIKGLMGMAAYTDNMDEVRREFRALKDLFEEIKRTSMPDIDTLSMGMSDDYLIAVQEGSTMVRVGSMIFGERK